MAEEPIENVQQDADADTEHATAHPVDDVLVEEVSIDGMCGVY